MANGLEKGVKNTLTFLEKWATQQGWPVDGARADEVTAEGIKPVPGEMNSKVEADEIFAVVFGHFTAYSQTLQNTPNDPFKKIGMDLSWIKPDPSGKDLFQVTDEFKDRVKKDLLGERGIFQSKSIEYKNDFTIASDNPKNGVEVIRYAYARTEFKLLPFEEQKAIIDQYVDSLSLKGTVPDTLKKAMKDELGKLRLGLTLPKVIAQDAVFESNKLQEEADGYRRQIVHRHRRKPGYNPHTMDPKVLRRQDEADQKLGAESHRKAKALLEMALQMDPDNVLAHRQMAKLYYEGEPRNFKQGRRSMIEAIRCEKSQMGQTELVMSLEWVHDPEIKDSWKFFDDKMKLLPNREKELVDLHLGPPAVYSDKDFERNYPHLVAAYQAGGRDDALMMKLVKDARNMKDVLASNKALFPNEEERYAFESQLATWVAKGGDPILAHKILTEGSTTIGDIAKVPLGKALALHELYNNPDIWLNAAENAYGTSQLELVKDATQITQGRLAWQKIGEETSIVFIPDFFLRKDSDPDLKAKLDSKELEPLSQQDYSEKLGARVKQIYANGAGPYIDFQKQVDKEIEATQLKLYTAEGPARDEAFNRLGELQMGRAALNVLDYYQFGLSNNSAYQDLTRTVNNYIEQVRQDPYRRDILVEETFAAIDKQFAEFEKYVNTHPELAEYLVPQLKVLREDLEVLRKDSEGSFGRWQFNRDIIPFRDRLSKMGIAGADHLYGLTPIFTATQVKLANGVLNRDPRLFSEGLQDLNVIMDYSKLDQKKAGTMVSYASMQPTNSKLIFDLNLDPKNPKVKELNEFEAVTDQASFETLKTSTLWKAANKFVQDYDTASFMHLSKTCADLNKSWDYQGKDYSNFWDVPAGKDATIEDLKNYNSQLRTIYGGPENSQILSKIQDQTTKENLKENKGFKIRQEFGEAMASYHDMVAMEKTYDVLEAQNFEGVTSDQAIGVRDFYLKRGAAYGEFLGDEIERIREAEKKDAPQGMQTSKEGWTQVDTGEKGAMGATKYRWVGPKEAAAELVLLKYKAEFFIQKKPLESLSTEDPVQALKTLKGYHKTFQGLEEAHLDGLLLRQTEMVKSIKGDDGSKEYKDLDWIPHELRWAKEATKIQDRLIAYQKIQTKIDGFALLQSVKAKKEMLGKMADEVGTTDKVLNLLKDIDPFNPGVEVDGKSRFKDTIKVYERVEELLKSGDPEKINEGRKLFIELEQSGNQKGLAKDYKWSSYYNQFTIGVGIVLAAAITGGAAAGAVGILGGGAIAQGFTMAAVFTLSSRVYRAAIYDGETVAGAFAAIVKDPLGFGEEVLLNWAMFGVIGKANKVFLGYFEKGVQEVAVKNLVAKGLLEEGAKVTEELLAKSPALKLALEVESKAVRQGFFTMALGKGGQFATEVMAFQGWEVAMTNYQHIKKGTWSFGKFGESFQAFLPDHVAHGALFLLALKGGGVFSMPVTKFMEAKFTKIALGKLDKEFQNLQLEINATEAAAVKYFEKGEGNITDILTRYKDAALKRKALLDKVPAELLDPAAKALNELYIKQIELLESGIVSWEKIFGYDNPYGNKTTEAGIQKFSDAQGPLLVKTLAEHPWVQNLRVSSNGIIEFNYADPMTGQKSFVRLLSEGKIKADEIMAMQDQAMAKLDAQWGPSDAKTEKSPPTEKSPTTEKGEDTVKIKSPVDARNQAMAAQPGEAVLPKPDFGPAPDPKVDISDTTGTLHSLDGNESFGINFANFVYQKVRIDNVTLVIHEAAGENGKTVYKMTYFGPKGAVRIYQGKDLQGKAVPSAQHGKGAFEINIGEGAVIEVNGKTFSFYKPEISTREVQAKESAAVVARYKAAREGKGKESPTSEVGTWVGPQGPVQMLPQKPVMMEQGGKTVRQGDAVLDGAAGPIVVDSSGRVYQELPDRKGNLLFYPDKNPRDGTIGHYVRFFGEEGTVKIQKGGKGKFKILETGGKPGDKTSPRHELKDGDVLLINGEKVVYRSPEALRSEAEKRSLIKTERENLDSELKLIQAEPDQKVKDQKYKEFKVRQTAFEEMLVKEKRSVEGVPFAEEMANTSRTVAGAVFDGKVINDGSTMAKWKEMPLFNEDGSVNPAARRKLRDQMVSELYRKGVTISSDSVKTGEDLNTVAVDSMIDLALTAKQHGIIDTPGGLTRGQFFRLINELYLHKSPSVRISGAELTHVPMVVESTLGFLERQNPKATVEEKKTAFVAALFHDAGKWDPNLRTETGVTIKPSKKFNPTGKSIEIRPGESFNEALDRYQSEGKITAVERGQIKMPGFLISVVAHHDSIAVFETLKQLETEGILPEGGASKAKKIIQRHLLVSSFLLNVSGLQVGDLNPTSKNDDWGVYSHVLNNPSFKRYIELYYELTNEMLEGKKLDLSADTMDPRILELRKIFAKEFDELDRALLMGDHQGQNDPSKYMGILATSPANKEAKIWHLLLGGDPVNSVNGVLSTHSGEQRLLMPEAGGKAAEDFQKTNAWLSQMDPTQPGLAQTLMAKDSPTKQLFDAWVKKNPDKPATVEAWLKDEKVLGEDGKPSDTFNDIKAAVEKGFYEHFIVDHKESLFEWEKPSKPEAPAIELSDADLKKMVVEEEHLLTDKDLVDVRDAKTPPPIPDQAKVQSKNVTPEVMKERIGDAFKMLREFGVGYDGAYLQLVGRAAAIHKVDPAEARRIFKAIDAGLEGVTDMAAYGIARRAIFIEVLEGRMTLEEAQNLGKSILRGEVRISLAEIQMEVPQTIGFERPFDIEIVVPREQMGAMRDAHVQRAFSATGRDPMDPGSARIKEVLRKALDKGHIDLVDLYQAAGVGLKPQEIKAREEGLGLPRNQWMSELAKDPKGFTNKIKGLFGEEIFIDSATLEQMIVKDAESPPKSDKKAAPTEDGKVIPLASRRKGRAPKTPKTAKIKPENEALAAQPKEADTSKAEASPLDPSSNMGEGVRLLVGKAVDFISRIRIRMGLGSIIPGEFYLAPKPTKAETEAGKPAPEPKGVSPQAAPKNIRPPLPEPPPERTEAKPAQGNFGSAAGKTHFGAGKKVNEDDFLMGTDFGVVFDGMGGMTNGVHATRVAKEEMGRKMDLTQGGHGDLFRAMKEGGEAVNASEYHKGGTVAAGYHIIRHPDGTATADIVHSGDTVAMVIGPDKAGKMVIKHRTRDQSMVEGMFRPEGSRGDKDPVIEGGELPMSQPHAAETELKMRANPNANVVYGGLGVGNETKPIRTQVPLAEGDFIVLFSDGIGDNLSSREILDLVKKSKTADEAQKKIFDAGLEKMSRLMEVQEEFQRQGEKKLKNRNYRGKERIPWVGPKNQEWWVDSSYNVYDAQKGGKLVDHLKPDNLTVLVYKNDVPTRHPAEAPIHEELPLAAQPAEAVGVDTMITGSLWGGDAANSFGRGSFQITGGRVEISRLPQGMESFDLSVGTPNPGAHSDRPRVVVDEKMGAQSPENWAHFEKTPTGWRVENQRTGEKETIMVVQGKKTSQIKTGEHAELAVGDEVQIGMNQFKVDANGDLVMDNPYGLQIGGEIFIP